MVQDKVPFACMIGPIIFSQTVPPFTPQKGSHCVHYFVVFTLCVIVPSLSKNLRRGRPLFRRERKSSLQATIFHWYTEHAFVLLVNMDIWLTYGCTISYTTGIVECLLGGIFTSTICNFCYSCFVFDRKTTFVSRINTTVKKKTTTKKHFF